MGSRGMGKICLGFLATFSLMLAGCGGNSGTPPAPDVFQLPDDDAAPPDAGNGADAMPNCFDGDEDGFGDGCVLGEDCDDSDPAVNPNAPEVCDGVDNDCNESIDDGLVAPSCELTDGVCAGATATCGGAAGWLPCDDGNYGAN